MRGRPDVTVFGPGGADSSRVAWIVGECKDEHGAVASGPARLSLYAEKAKYITADTAYFMMADPGMLVIRPIGSGDAADIEVPWAGLTIEAFAEKLAPLRAEVAGVPEMLQEFRAGNETLIARDKLTAAPAADAAEQLAVQINRNVFFDTLGENTHLLQQATLHALQASRQERQDIEKRVAAFGEKYGGHIFRAYPIAIEGKKRRGASRTRRTGKMQRCYDAISCRLLPLRD